MRISLASSGLILALGLVACTRPNDAGPAVDLTQAVGVVSSGARPISQVTAYRTGQIDPIGTDMVLPVKDATVEVRLSDRRALVSIFDLPLDDMNVPPSRVSPEGLRLRELTLSTPRMVSAEILERTPDELTLRIEAPLRLDSKLVLADGSLYPLGGIQTEPSVIDLHVGRSVGDTFVTTVDAAPPGTCVTVEGLFELRDCALYLETVADPSMP